MAARLSLSSIDLDDLATALDDHGGWGSWYLDPATGKLVLSTDDGHDHDGHDDEDLGDLIAIDPLPSRLAYVTMVAFADAVPDPLARSELHRALEGSGAFRRFRDRLDRWPEIGLRWRDVDRVACELRALRWLDDQEVVDSDELEEAIADRRRRLERLLAALAEIGPQRFDADEVAGRWAEIAHHVDAGGVVLTRGGEDWCTITPIRPTD